MTEVPRYKNKRRKLCPAPVPNQNETQRSSMTLMKTKRVLENTVSTLPQAISPSSDLGFHYHYTSLSFSHIETQSLQSYSFIDKKDRDVIQTSFKQLLFITLLFFVAVGVNVCVVINTGNLENKPWKILETYILIGTVHKTLTIQYCNGLNSYGTIMLDTYKRSSVF